MHEGWYFSKLHCILVPKLLFLRRKLRRSSSEGTVVESIMQGHCNENDCFGYVSGNLLSIQKSFFKLTAIPQAWYKTNFKSVIKKIVLLDKDRSHHSSLQTKEACCS